MTKRLFYQQSEPGSRIAATAQRLSVKARIMMALFALMLIPQGAWAQGTGDYPITINHYVGGYKQSIAINSTNEDDVLGDGPTSPVTVKFKYNSTDNTGTLTLNNVNFNGWIESELDELIIEFEGTNRLSGTGPSGSGHDGYIRNIKTSGEATLTLKPVTTSSTLYINQETAFYSVVDGFNLKLSGHGGIPAYASYYSPFYFDSSTKQYKFGNIVGNPLLETITFTATPTYPIWIGGSGASGCSQAKDDGTSVGFSNTTVTSGTATFDSYTNTLELNGATVCDIWSGLDNLKINLKGANTLNHDSYGGPASPIFSVNGGTLTLETTDGTGSLTFLNTSGSSYTDPIGGFSTVTYDDHLDLVKNSANQDEIMVAYKLWVAGKRVTGSNAANVLNDGTVSYNAATNKLTLNHAQLDEGIWTTMADLNIHFIGNDCWISPDAAKPSNCILSLAATPGTLKFTKENDGDKLVLYNSRQGYTAIRGFNAIDDVNGLPLETQNPYKIVNDGYYRLRREITNSLDTATTNIDYAIVSADEVYPLWLSSKQVTSANASNIIGWGSYDSGTKTLTLTGLLSDVTGSSGNPYYGVTTGVDNLTVKLVALVGDRNYIKCRGTDDIAFKGYGNASTITFSPDASNPGSLEMYVANSDGAHWFDGVTPSYQGTLALHDEGYDGSTFYVSTIAPVTNYDLWVDGTQVTSVNKNSINGGSLISYDPATYTLTLKDGASFFVDADPAIKSGLANLTVDIEGSASMTPNGSSFEPAFEGTVAGATITFTSSSASPNFKVKVQGNYFNNITPVYNNGLCLFDKYNSGAYGVDGSIMLPAWTGAGTDSAPYLIKTYDDLKALSEFVNGDFKSDNMFFKLDQDINCSGAAAVFNSIGKRYKDGMYGSYFFNGTFDGANYTISNLSSTYGLFGVLEGTVKNLKLVNCTVNGGTSNPYQQDAAALAAKCLGTIENCTVSGGSVSNGSNGDVFTVGGIAGYFQSGTISNCVVENATLTLDGALTYKGSCGGIVGQSYDGTTISGCSVKNTQISANTTTGSNPLYAGAIVGWREKEPSLSGNTYDYLVNVKTQVGTDPTAAIIKSGNDQRGLGDGDDIIPGAELKSSDLKKINVASPTSAKGKITFISGYYSKADDNSYAYALPYTKSNQKTKMKAQSELGYDVPTLYVKKSSDNDWVTNTVATDYTNYNEERTFEMPDEAVNASATFPIDLSNTRRSYTITDPADPIVYNNGTAVDIKEIKTTLNSVDVTLAKGTDYTISGYQDDQGAAITTGAPSDAGNYKVVISAAGDNSGTATIPFTIDQKSVSITAADEAVTYNGTAQNYASATGSGTFVVTYYTTEDDRTNNKNALTGAPTNANTYYVKVSQGDNNYSSADALATFKIDPLTATLNWTNTTFTYDGTAKVPTATVTNLIGTDACDVTVTGAETNASATSYTATATALSNNNYALPSGVTQTFTINPLAATPDVVLTIPTSYVYDGTAKTPAVAVSVSGVALTTDDYSVAYTDNINAGRAAAKATVTLKRNYSGSKVETFDINPLTATLSWGNTTFVYNGTAQAPTATVTNLVGTDVCNVTVGGAETAAGSYTATATALDNTNYQLPASPTTTFTILDRTATIDFGDRTFKTYYDANETFIVPDGTTAYIVTGVSGNAVTIQKVSYIKAGVPVLLESTPGSTVAKNVSETFTGNLLKYAAAATPATEKHYLLYKNEFVRASGTISNKVYLDLAGYSGGARSLVIGDGTTAIEGIAIDEEDGDAKWYDMQGRRINKPTKAGLYIKDGQKVVVKTRY